MDLAGYDKQHGPHSEFECTAPTGGANTNLDCDDPFPNNEPDIEVDPANPLHMIASSNDYGSCCDQYYTTFDGGATWSTGNMSTENAARTDRQRPRHGLRHEARRGAALVAELLRARRTSRRRATVTSSSRRRRTAASTGSGPSWSTRASAATWTRSSSSTTRNGSSPTTTRARSSTAGRTSRGRSSSRTTASSSRSAIFESHSDDGGSTGPSRRRSRARTRRSARSRRRDTTGECDENQFSVPTVGPDGTVYVAFENSRTRRSGSRASVRRPVPARQVDGRRQALVEPTFIVGLEDGSNDYPINVDGRQTLTGYQVRVNSAGNIVASPTTERCTSRSPTTGTASTTWRTR